MKTADIIKAALDDDVLLVTQLLDKGADINAHDGGYTILHIACLHGNASMAAAILKHTAISRYDFSRQTKQGFRPWQIAAINHHFDLMRMVGEAEPRMAFPSSRRPQPLG